MENWRAKPRTGKSEVVPLTAEIESRLQMGQTIKQVYDALTDNQHISIGYRQFVRHVKTLTPSITPIIQVEPSLQTSVDDPKQTETVISNEGRDSSPKKIAPLTREDFANIRNAPIDLKALSRPVKRSEQ
ncbi:hypothetical protein HRJ41_26040 (plasmid) [Pseudomonas sp. BF61]|nr:hypothetical protein [Pseudomonas sp. BF61]